MVHVDVRDGRPVLVRAAAGAAGAALRSEAAILRTIAGTGVPEVVDSADDGDEVRLVTSLAPPLVLRGLPPTAIAAVAADVADVLSRAHDHGIVHGPLRDDHLRGHPDAIVVGGWETAGPGDAGTDVGGLGRLLERLGADGTGLRGVVARTTAPEPPTMRALAESLRDLIAEPPPRRRLARPRRPLVAGLSAAAVLVGAGLVVSTVHGPTTPTAVAPRATTTSTAAASTTTWRDRRVQIDANRLERAGEAWTIGIPGDVVVVGDWNCDGEPTPVVLRPSTGTVWAFATWPDADDAVEGTPLAHVPGAVRALAIPAGRCDQLEVVDAQGRSTTVG